MRELIFRLARPMMRLLGREERGAIGVLVGVLIGGGVLLGMGALAIDVGQLYQNRAELQNGADAAALAVADSCALGTCTTGIAGQYATGNASKLTNNNAAVGLVCGSGTGMAACPASTGKPYDCPPNPAAGTNYVDVHTSTLTGSGSTLLPPVFARTLLGNRGYAGTNVKACAQAEWGAPTSAQTIAFTISACSWYAYTNNGANFAQPPPYPPNTVPPASDDHILFEHGSSGSTTTGSCPLDNQSGADAPGNFGWTSDPSGNCSTFINNGSYGGGTGTPASGACQTILQNAQANKTVVYLPVYTAISGTGNNVTYTLLGFAAFVITGYHITGSFKANDWLNPANKCTGNQFCIYGYFTQGLIPSTGGLGGGKGLGASIVKLTG
jgi:Flp pilus assembly protein TadG